ncbi:MAG: hypothetical protein A2908_04175 [Candidatus Staskawiczbacteria bacterium RIFCSPLOWO2_01_FULL_38_12b]|uniref:Uncharacterized protein n=1 Tax=Candidatus Staskawiczbacteria bacterium RIFCSPLOWO2_01_FULL_38_12b TaxID=1802214 RepID=A0A1G2IFE4_9BACT|nr:MAG: hypothetical protein A2908_04175 [Candidatus Staskawiczbacteria bacterium RIFCSPLOWO2_01_FULL_38_12b]
MVKFTLVLIIQDEEQTHDWYISKEFEKEILPRPDDVIAIATEGFEVTTVNHCLDDNRHEVMCDSTIQQACRVFLTNMSGWKFGGDGFKNDEEDFLVEIINQLSDKKFLLETVRRFPDMHDFRFNLDLDLDY